MKPTDLETGARLTTSCHDYLPPPELDGFKPQFGPGGLVLAITAKKTCGQR